LSHIAHRHVHRDFLIGVAVTTLIALATVSLSLLGPILSLFMPLPILFYRLKLGRLSGLLILGAVSLIVASLAGRGALGTAVFLFEVGLVGLVLPELFEMKLTVEKTVGMTAGVILVTSAVMLGLYGAVSTTSPWALAADYLEKSAGLALDMYRQMEPSEQEIGKLAASMEEIVYLVLRVTPALLIVGTLFLVWSNLLLARPLLRNKRLLYPDFGPLAEWRAPEPLVWVAIGSGCLLLVGHESLKIIGINGLIVMMMVYFFQGIAIVSFYFKKKQFPKLWRAVLYSLIAMQQLFLLAVIALGFFDMWVDFRRTRKVES
jgi:uncharacterized protein YybS (DUF2232 family)